MGEHKNKSRAPVRPLNLATLGLSVGGLGFLRPAPGTWGSLPPAGLAFVMVLAGVPLVWQVSAMGALVVVFGGACVVWGRYAESRFGRKDAAEVVADETAGCAITVAGACSALGMSEGGVGAALDVERAVEAAVLIGWAFVLFRGMDVLKPWPAGRLERLPYGWGVLMDDLMAGVYGLVLLGVSVFAARWVGVWG